MEIFPERIPDYIIFDWDGTIVDTLLLIKKVHSDVFEAMGYQEWSEEDAERYMRFSAKELYPKIFKENADKAFAYLERFLNDNDFGMLKLFIGAEDIIKMLAERGVGMSVVSHKRHDYLIKEVTKLNFCCFFDEVIGSGYLEFDKPDARIRDYLFKKLSLENNSILVIGDSVTDFKLAQNCNFGFMPVGNSEWIEKYRKDCAYSNLCYHGFNDFIEFKKYIGCNYCLM